MVGRAVVDAMMKHDAFSQWLQLDILEVGEGYCVGQMIIRAEMLNGFGVCHGGVTFAFADSIFAFASNSRGKHAVSIETSISHTRPVFKGNVLTATAKEISRTKTLGIYDVHITNELGKTIALFRGTVFIKDTDWVS